MGSNLYTIPSDFDFLDVLAKRLLAETASDPLSLKDYGIILPNKIACEAFKDKLKSLNEGRPMIMPQVATLDDMDDDVLSLRMAAGDGFIEKILEIPPAVSKQDRELHLTREILKHTGTANSMSAAVSLARELASFIDELHETGVPLEKLADIDAADFPGDIEKTKDILKIVTETWPKIKADMGVIDQSERRQEILKTFSRYIERHNVKRPLILAGFRNFSKGMTQLIGSVVEHDNYFTNLRVVLPGVELEMGHESWGATGPSHPQYAFKKLLEDIGLDKADVRYFYGTTESTHSKRAIERRKLLREAMRPSETTHKWKHLKVFGQNAKLRPSTKVLPKGSPLSKKKTAGEREIDPIALTGLDLIIAGTPQEEASTIALKFREMLEKPDKKGVLITPDEALAMRVVARLQHWDIKAAPEGGIGLINSRVGAWTYHCLEMATSNLAPISLLETMKSPFTAMGGDPDELHKTVLDLQDMVMYGPRPWPGYDGLKRSIRSSFNEAAARSKSADRKKDLEQREEKLLKWVDTFKAEVMPYTEILGSDKPQSFKDLLTAHIHMLETLANTDQEKGADRIWVGKEGIALHRVFSNLLKSCDIMPDMTGQDYMQLIKATLQKKRINGQSHPRIRILTPEQARLVSGDLNIVAGLTSNNWPGSQSEKFWLSSEIRQKLGLQPLETKIGASAYDFVNVVSCKNTLMTRAERDQNAPTVPSPFLTRMAMLLRGLGLEDKLSPKTKVLEINSALHRPAKVTPIGIPAPKPPEKARPKQLSVSGIEMLLRDPYAVYARYVLKLFPRDEIDADPSFAERGNIIHEALDRFKETYPDEMPENAYEELIKFGQDAFEQRLDNPSVRAFWWPRFERMAKWFVEYEQARAGLAKTLKTEVPGKLEIETDQGKFILTAIADRIDALMDDSLSIIDYKTGSVPTKKDVERGLSPQLTLEALIAVSGGFKGIDAKDVGLLEYWKLSGARPAGKVQQYEDIEQLQVEALEGLTKLISHFSKKSSPYLPTPRPKVAPKYVPYNHLGRSDEWGADVSKGKAGGRGRPNVGRGRK